MCFCCNLWSVSKWVCRGRCGERRDTKLDTISHLSIFIKQNCISVKNIEILSHLLLRNFPANKKKLILFCAFNVLLQDSQKLIFSAWAHLYFNICLVGDKSKKMSAKIHFLSIFTSVASSGNRNLLWEFLSGQLWLVVKF